MFKILDSHDMYYERQARETWETILRTHRISFPYGTKLTEPNHKSVLVEVNPNSSLLKYKFKKFLSFLKTIF